MYVYFVIGILKFNDVKLQCANDCVILSIYGFTDGVQCRVICLLFIPAIACRPQAISPSHLAVYCNM